MELSATNLTNESTRFDTEAIPLFLRASYNYLYQNRGFDVLDLRLGGPVADDVEQLELEMGLGSAEDN